MPKISVVIPFYNRIDKTINAINSVLNQTYDDYEIIAVNDGSSENISLISEIIAQNDSKIRLISYSPNKGASNARNVGIENSNGEYIAFLDSDDLFLPEKLEYQIEQMERNNSYFSHTSYIRNINNQRKTMNTSYANGNMIPKIISSCPIATPTVMIKREILINNDVKFDIKLKYGEDTVFWMEILKNCEILGIDKPLTIVNVSKDSCVSNSSHQLTGYKTIITYVINDDVYKKYDIEILKLFDGFETILKGSSEYKAHQKSKRLYRVYIFFDWLRIKHYPIYNFIKKTYHFVTFSK